MTVEEGAFVAALTFTIVQISHKIRNRVEEIYVVEEISPTCTKERKNVPPFLALDVGAFAGALALPCCKHIEYKLSKIKINVCDLGCTNEDRTGCLLHVDRGRRSAKMGKIGEDGGFWSCAAPPPADGSGMLFLSTVHPFPSSYPIISRIYGPFFWVLSSAEQDQIFLRT